MKGGMSVEHTFRFVIYSPMTCYKEQGGGPRGGPHLMGYRKQGE